MATNESIYALADQDEYKEDIAYGKINYQPSKKQYYRSIYYDKVRQEVIDEKARYNGCATMGPGLGVVRPNVDQWVKKNQGHPDLPKPQEYHFQDQLPRKPPVPNQFTDRPVCGIKSNVDFIKQNIKKAQLMVPPAEQQKEIDWTMKSDFGKVPNYLPKLKQTIQQEQEQLRDIENANLARGRVKAFRLDDDEKQELLEKLKRNWKDLHSEYIGNTKAILDTFAQKNRKVWLEERLAEIEADITLLEHDNVFVQ